MKHYVPFEFHGKKNFITVDYREMADEFQSGFHIIPVPFSPAECRGYPMLHAYFENLSLAGYERYCGFIQFIRREEYADISAETPARVSYDIDITEDMRARKFPYFALGYPPELFDAPCRNLQGAEKLVWRAYTYLVDVPSRINDNRLTCLAGFSWGYTENSRGEVSLLDFSLLTKKDWDSHKIILDSI